MVVLLDGVRQGQGQPADVVMREHTAYSRAVHRNPLTPAEQRVLGCLIEKRFTTPDQYPLTLNALRLACNQSTNREPVMALEEGEVRQAAQELCRYGLARLASGHTTRAVKYRHLAEDALGLDRDGLAMLAVLLLRGAQTPGELKARTERMAPLGSLARVEEVLAELIGRGYAGGLGRQPGQKEERFTALLGDVLMPNRTEGVSDLASKPLEDRVAGLERAVGALQAQIEELRSGAPVPPGT